MRKPDDIERLYIDFDSFFASVEQHLDPALRDQPVGVVPLMSNATSIIAASKQAKKFGIRTGTPVREARRLCPDIVLREARHDVYVRLHHALVALVDRHVPVHGVRSIDEMVCTLLDNERPRALEIAQGIKAELKRKFEGITGSIGLAPNELLAKVAAEMKKPDGLVILRPQDLPGPLLDLPITDLPGIAAGTSARLARASIVDMQGLWNMAPKQARAVWRSVEGERFWAALHGYAIERGDHERSMFGHSRVLSWDWRTLDKAYACARLLLVKAARRMRREGFCARTLTLSLRGEGEGRWAGEAALGHARDDHTVLAALTLLFRHARESSAVPPRIKKVAVILHSLVRADSVPRDLFADPQADRARARWEILTEIGDRLHARYGRDTLMLGPMVRPPGGYAGAKIAFNRIPALADF